MSSEVVPKYIYKILPTAPPEPFPEALPFSTLDAGDGFVHLCTAQQAASTASLFFTEFANLWLVKLELSKLQDPLKWEDTFPHLYGNFGAQDVISVQKFDRSADQTWKQAMEQSQWLE